MKNYYRIMLGRKSAFASEARQGNYIGADFDVHIDLSDKLPQTGREFNNEFVPLFLENNPEKTKMSASLASGMLWTICKGICKGDIILSPDGNGNYYVGEVVGDYYHHKGGPLPHRRPVEWFGKTLSRENMSESLRNSSNSIGTVSTITKYAEEIESLLEGRQVQVLNSTDPDIENASEFALEKHLEDFLVQNWSQTSLGVNYDIFQDGDSDGRQHMSDTGPIDILAISKDKKEILVVELKKGRASDVVVGQIQRYMGYVKDELAESDQVVRGIIIAFSDDLRIRRALSVTSHIDFYTYTINFSLTKK